MPHYTNRKKLARALQKTIPELTYQQALRLITQGQETVKRDRPPIVSSNIQPAPKQQHGSQSVTSLIPLGRCVPTGEPVGWDLAAANANALVFGRIGSASSRILTETLAKAALSRSKWRFYACTAAYGYVTHVIPKKQCRVETTADGFNKMLHELVDLLDNPTGERTLLLVDELTALLDIDGQQFGATGVNRYKDNLACLDRLAREGRESNIFIMAHTQNPELLGSIPRTLLESFGTRIFFGPLPDQLELDEETVSLLFGETTPSFDGLGWNRNRGVISQPERDTTVWELKRSSDEETILNLTSDDVTAGWEHVSANSASDSATVVAVCPTEPFSRDRFLARSILYGAKSIQAEHDRTLVIDTDLANSCLSKVLGMYTPTIVNIHKFPEEDTRNNIVRCEEYDCDAILGPVQPKSSVSLGRELYSQLLHELKNEYSLILLVCSPDDIEPLREWAVEVSHHTMNC